MHLVNDGEPRPILAELYARMAVQVRDLKATIGQIERLEAPPQAPRLRSVPHSGS